MKTSRAFFTVLFLGTLALQACSPDNAAAVATSVAATLQISQLETAAAGGGQASGGAQDSDQSAGSAAVDEVPTATATITPTATQGVPMVSVSQNTNCRSGPRIDYTYVTVINAGEEVEVLKTFPNANYVVVRNPNGSGDCWLWLQYANQTDFSSFGLAAATQPPTPTPSLTPTNTATPTPSYNWNGTWSIWVGGVPYTMTMTQTGGSVSATFPSGADTVTLTGNLSSGWQTASGNWVSSGGPSGTFEFKMLNANLNQFIGNYNAGALPWCGARGGAAMPAPCMGP